MISIPLANIRRAASRKALDELSATQRIINALPDDQRGKAIKGNSDKWSALKQDLWKLGDMKCWYSEANIECNLAEVEHFRPKRRVTGEHHPGYWWCAFKWENYRIAHPLVNKRLTDYQTGKLGGKGCYFPLRNGCPRATCEKEQIDEEPVLLDPVSVSDCELIVFDSSNGVPIPKYSGTEDEWHHYRAKESINFYHLDEGSWNAAREDIMKAVSNICDRLLDLKATTPFDANEYDRVLEDLNEYLNPYAQFLSAAKQVLLEKKIDVRL
jgi:hypothetical protein